jgi:hypothetical protein
MRKKKILPNVSEYRILKRDGIYSIIKVFLNKKDEIVGYTDYIIPTGESKLDLKVMISSMLIATRKPTLTE